MAEISYSGDALEVQVTGWDKVWALKSHLTIPLAHIVSAEPAGDEARRVWHGLRLPGTNIPGVITAGTFYKDGGRVFWDVHHADRAVAIQLRDDEYSELVVEVDDPGAVIALINNHASR